MGDDKQLNYVHTEPLTPPKPKRFANYGESFIFFLKNVKYYNKGRDSTPAVSKLKEIILEFLKSVPWVKEGDSYRMATDKDTNTFRKFKFTDKEIEDHTTWENIDFLIRMILEKKSGLSVSKREYLLYIFEYVDHFTAKDGEEVTQQNEYVPED